MKNSRLFTILLAFGGVVGMAACNDDTNTGPVASVTVNFGSGTEAWSAADVYAEASEGMVFLDFYKSADSDIPSTDGIVSLSGITTFADGKPVGEYYYGSEYFYWDYWSSDYANRVTTVDGDNRGDWWVDSGTVTITSYANALISGKVNLIMMDGYAASQGDTEVSTKSLTITFSNIPVVQESNTSAHHKHRLADIM